MPRFEHPSSHGSVCDSECWLLLFLAMPLNNTLASCRPPIRIGRTTAPGQAQFEDCGSPWLCRCLCPQDPAVLRWLSGAERVAGTGLQLPPPRPPSCLDPDPEGELEGFRPFTGAPSYSIWTTEAPSAGPETRRDGKGWQSIRATVLPAPLPAGLS